MVYIYEDIKMFILWKLLWITKKYKLTLRTIMKIYQPVLNKAGKEEERNEIRTDLKKGNSEPQSPNTSNTKHIFLKQKNVE